MQTDEIPVLCWMLLKMLEKLLLPPEVADALGVRVDTLRTWRARGIGPKYLYVGRMVRYRPDDVTAFAREGEQRAQRRRPVS